MRLCNLLLDPKLDAILVVNVLTGLDLEQLIGTLFMAGFRIDGHRLQANGALVSFWRNFT